MSSTTPSPGGTYRRRLLVNTASLGVSTGWAIVVTLATVPLLLRGLGAEAFGTWILLQTFSATTGWLSLADLGMGVATVREVARTAAAGDRRAVASSVASSLGVYGIGAALSAVALAALGPVLLPALFSTPAEIRPALATAVRWFALQVVAELAMLAAMAAFEGMQRLDRARWFDVARRTAVAAASVPLALATGDLVAVAAGAALATSAVAVAALLVLVVPLRHDHLVPSVARARRLIGFGAQAGLVRGTGVLHRTMDRLVVGALLGPAPVALVEVATQVQNGVSAVLSTTSHVATSSAAWVHTRGDPGALEELLVRGTRYSTLATVTVAAVVAVLADPLVEAWVGSAYREAAPLVVLGLVYLASQAPLQVGSNILQGLGLVRAVLGPAALAVVVNLVASVVLTRWLGVSGAFLGTLVGGAVLTPLLLRSVLRHSGTTLGSFTRSALRPAVPPAALGALAAAGALLLPASPWARLLAGLAAGGLAAALVAWRWSIRPEEWRELRRLVLGDRSAPSQAA